MRQSLVTNQVFLIPRSMRCLGTLEEKGWIGSDDSRPTNYIAKSPTTSLDTTKQSLDTEFSNNQNKILAELVPLV